MASKAQMAARAKFAAAARAKNKTSKVGRAAASTTKPKAKKTAKKANPFAKKTAKKTARHPTTGRFVKKKG
jgi:hypothetical protein